MANCECHNQMVMLSADLEIYPVPSGYVNSLLLNMAIYSEFSH